MTRGVQITRIFVYQPPGFIEPQYPKKHCLNNTKTHRCANNIFGGFAVN